jgi:SAM-dependent methyltransferase
VIPKVAGSSPVTRPILLVLMNDAFDYYGQGRPSTIFYDIVEGVYRPIEPELAFYLELAKTVQTPIVELGCGTGRIAWALAEAGHQVLGFDNASAMIERAQSMGVHYSHDINNGVRFVLADICSLRLEQAYDLVIAPYRVFNHLVTQQAQQQCLESIKHHLSAAGTAVFDSTLPDKERLLADAEFFRKKPSLVIELPHVDVIFERRITNNQSDAASQTFTTDFSYKITGPVGIFEHVDRLVQRWATDEQIREMIALAGLKIVAMYQDFNRAPLEENGDRIWVLKHA